MNKRPYSDYRDTLKLAREYIELPGNENGGNLHIVLDDGNLETKSILYCEECAFDEDDFRGVHLAASLLGLSKTQRKKVYLNLRKKESEQTIKERTHANNSGQKCSS